MNRHERQKLFLCASAFAILFLASSACAATVVGAIYENNIVGSGNAIPSNVPTTVPDVTFTTSSPINFASGSAYTIGEFLSSGTGSTILTGAGELGNTLNNTLFNFVGTVSVTSGETFTAGHDDGLTLVINGITVISAPSPTAYALTTSTYTGPSGTFPFQLVYGETAGAPGDITVNLPLQSVISPEPASFLLAGLGLFAVASGIRRQAKN